ncbi:MAG TPA: NAD(P)H-dependent glycerol-3-phosphate dehydrogenase [Saprospiraceae bacterium]|nr:NAD(P)H-dependent glycerol-3-phosphate dehydrogenase [Saprospiraceae bacterium]HQW54495.1 NAD(P)H-dependent glycerol-3-phosphate dehydrogenase [Saprospiraceae bacterium]
MRVAPLVFKDPVGVLGSGTFGITVAHLLSQNVQVLLYSRSGDIVDQINTKHTLHGYPLHERISATNDLSEIAQCCNLIFPVIPSEFFRQYIRMISPHLSPRHILIHGTKGFDVIKQDPILMDDHISGLSRQNIRTMSEVILEETNVLRVGALAGPNLYKEIMEGQYAATVIASKFDEVIKIGQRVLDGPRFAVFGSYEILGAELSGALKNIIALCTGMLNGLGMGKNIEALLITRGLRELIYIGKAMNVPTRAFLGTSGIGDLIATATSSSSRNYAFGQRLAKGESVDTISTSMSGVAEGVRVLRITNELIKHYEVNAPIITLLHKVVFEGYDIYKAIDFLMRYPYVQDVDFI